MGARGNDTLLGGTGNDTFVWNPGDGSDIIEGQSGADTLQFNGANIAEKIDITANGSRVRFARDIAGIVMDVNGVETINFTALGSADNITVGDLQGTNATKVNIDLSAVPGTGIGRYGAVDHVTATGTAGNDLIQVVASGSSATVLGLAAQTIVSGAESTDVLTVSGGAGNDTINASAVQAGSMSIVLDGGAGNDTVDRWLGQRSAVGQRGQRRPAGGVGNDFLFGGDGDDTLTGGDGDDQVFGEVGDDLMIWNPGDGTDLLEGGTASTPPRSTAATAPSGSADGQRHARALRPCRPGAVHYRYRHHREVRPQRGWRRTTRFRPATVSPR